ncbi:small, acid-soluble spore protein, alpha/beta type [Alkaliphilus hydrothermalis]|uniref:ABC-type Fe3+/spermidine/putrescine transport system ATPase subunit n=1 Tax=Alkaliphilus hydrothermalis TaxID=1482730 RepID=A0ABS2NSF0_9FIRM|nr:small, acid-soluble spore protein, alpha/beta type [Alkaliphilus hydrothermalis]MBM7615868.1 ABC-type Fe3+/spermidine/putrescine transport system ATPase subunit [Alkaliphilus hydrothermalis]
MNRGPIDQNARRAFTTFKEELANELGINSELSTQRNQQAKSMTKRMVRMGEGRLNKK